MAWEREFHHVHVDTGEHVISLVEKSAVAADGNAARHLLQIRMGEGPFEYHVGENKISIKLGGNFSVDEAGVLRDQNGTVFDPKDFEAQLTARLNAHTRKMRRYAARHGVPEFKGKKK